MVSESPVWLPSTCPSQRLQFRVRHRRQEPGAPRFSAGLRVSVVPGTVPACPHPLSAELSVTKRKRGRPKGSTKKASAEEEPAAGAAGASTAPPGAPEEAGPAPGCLECPKCARKFSNLRQLRKHICIVVLSLGEAEGDAGNAAVGRWAWRAPWALAAPGGSPQSAVIPSHLGEGAGFVTIRVMTEWKL